MLRLISTLRNKGLLTPVLLVLASLFILSLIIILGQIFHQTLQNEMAVQFNKQQLLLAQQVAINIDGFIDHVYKDISVISRLPDVAAGSIGPRARSVVENVHFHLESDILVTIRIVGPDGTILYDSSAPGREGGNLSKEDYFIKARGLRRHERIITELLGPAGLPGNAKNFIIAAPIYRGAADREPSFGGIVLALLSMDGITQKYLAPVKSGTRGYAWMMDSAGTLLYHPTQPQMVGKNLFQTDTSCFQCHRSFDSEKKMIEGEAETFGYYEAPGGENKVAAYFSIPVGTRTWIVVVSAPYTDVIALMQKSRMFYSFLIISIFVATLTASVVSIITYTKKIKFEEKARHLENQRKLEQEIVIAKNYLENIIENTKTNLLVLDREMLVTTVNTAQAKTLGRSKNDLIGKSFFRIFSEPLRPYDGIPIEALLHKTVSSGNSFEIKEYPIAGLQPEPVYLDMHVSPLLIAGNISGIIITSSNVTKRVLLEEALKKYTVELEVKVDKETATSRKLEQQVLHSEKLAALGRLAAGVAHEIGNPLTSISTFAQLLREMATDEFTQSSLDIINNHIQRITDIVRQMSTFARPDSSNSKLVEVNDILRSSLDLMRLDKRMKSTIEISTNFASGLPKLLLDDGQISQVIINIILNALDAMPDGGKLIVASGQSRDDQGRDAVAISITDTGTGIPTDSLAKIFDPFYTTKEVGKGTGLGLSVSYNIVKRFKGDIKVASTLGSGTTFTVILPILTETSKELSNGNNEHTGR
ncbi:MAG: ATP-binding protein [Nitrospirota bacterium]|nr:ATP-binding protein [Nitrospirota bacterium]